MTLLSTTEIPYDHYFWWALTLFAWVAFIRDGFIVRRYKRMTCNPQQLEKLVEARKSFRNWWRVIFITTFISAGLLFRFYLETNQ